MLISAVGLTASPIWIVIGWSPKGASAGSVKLTRYVPGLSPGTRPTKSGVIGLPPNVTVTVPVTGAISTGTSPIGSMGLVAPNPSAEMLRESPGCTGTSGVPGAVI